MEIPSPSPARYDTSRGVAALTMIWPAQRPFIASSSAAPKLPVVVAAGSAFGFAAPPFGAGPALPPPRASRSAPAWRRPPASLRMERPMRLRGDVDLDHPHLHHVAGLHHLVRVLHEAVGELARRGRARPGARRCRRRRRRPRRWSPCPRAACRASGPRSSRRPRRRSRSRRPGADRGRAWRARRGCRAPSAGRSARRRSRAGSTAFSRASSPISARRSRPQAATIRRATP